MADGWMVHDSHQLAFRNPFGAVSCGTEVVLRLFVRSGESVDKVTLCVACDGQYSTDIPMVPAGETNEGCVYEASWTAPAESGLWWYYFRVERSGCVWYCGNNARSLGGAGEVYPHVPPGYQITVYLAGTQTPAWWKDSVMYQIFVDRFCNGMDDGQVRNPKKDSLLHAHWDSTPLYIRDPDTKRVIRWDFYGGNLYGVKKQLPYLQELGVSVLYLNPIFESPSNHKYDTADYHKIDPMFGDNALFADLCAEAEQYGIKIILDGVFSHTGSDSLYFNREGNYPDTGAYQSKDSPYYSWYRFAKHPDEYECWWGIDVLPNVDEMNPSYQQFIIHGENSVLRYWNRMGAKGWRLDVADELPDAFIREFRRVLKEMDPESILIGEVWEDASNKVSYGERRGYLLGDELDSVMNYPFRRIALDFLLGRTCSVETHRALMSLYENYPKPHFYSLMNLISSHDVPRILTELQEAVPSSASTAEVRRELAVRRLKLLVVWQMTFPGVPSIYYGDEAGMEGGVDPYNRGPYPWGKENQELQAWYRQVIGWRKRYDVLRTGTWCSLALTPDVYGYIRRIEHGLDLFGQPKKDNTAVVLLNRSMTETIEVEVQVGEGISFFYDMLEDGRAVAIENGKLRLALPPLQSRLLLAGLAQ
jgi:cyclomaltodextrinase